MLLIKLINLQFNGWIMDFVSFKLSLFGKAIADKTNFFLPNFRFGSDNQILCTVLITKTEGSASFKNKRKSEKDLLEKN